MLPVPEDGCQSQSRSGAWWPCLLREVLGEDAPDERRGVGPAGRQRDADEDGGHADGGVVGGARRARLEAQPRTEATSC